MSVKKHCPNCGAIKQNSANKCLNCGTVFIEVADTKQQITKVTKRLSVIALCISAASIIFSFNLYAGLALATCGFILTAITKSTNDGNHTDISKKSQIIAIIGVSFTVLFRIIFIILQIIPIVSDLLTYL